MTTAQAVALLQVLLVLPDASGAKAIILAIAAAAGLPANVWILGRPSERWIEIVARAVAAWSVVPTQAARAPFWMLATDPGDVDDFGVPDQSADQTPRPGFLSASVWSQTGVQRGGATYAESFLTLTNTSASPIVLSPGTFFFEASQLPRSDGGTPTYVTSPDGAIYTGLGGTYTLNAGATTPVPIPVLAQQLGSYGSTTATTGAGSIDTCQTNAALSVTLSTVAIGSDREARSSYIARGERALDRLSYGGPDAAFLYAMNTAIDGTLLERYDGSGPVSITGGQIVPTTNGEVILYVYGPAGMVDSIDVSSATLNISGLVQGVITAPLGVLPATVELGPTMSDPNILPSGTPGCASVTNLVVPINFALRIPVGKIPNGGAPGVYGMPWVRSTVYAVGAVVQNGTRLYVCAGAGTSATSGGPSGTGSGISDGSATWNYSVAAGANTTQTLGVLTAIAAALAAYLLSTGPGGQDQVAGAGVVYVDMLGPAAVGAVPGLYNPVFTLPGGSSISVPQGHITVAGTVTGTLTAV